MGCEINHGSFSYLYPVYDQDVHLRVAQDIYGEPMDVHELLKRDMPVSVEKDPY